MPKSVNGHEVDTDGVGEPSTEDVSPKSLTFTLADVRVLGHQGSLQITCSDPNELVQMIRQIERVAGKRDRSSGRQFIEILQPQIPLVYETRADGRIICPKHQEPMTLHGSQDDTWPSHRVRDRNGKDVLVSGKPVYCKGGPGVDSPGWRYDRYGLREPE